MEIPADGDALRLAADGTGACAVAGSSLPRIMLVLTAARIAARRPSFHRFMGDSFGLNTQMHTGGRLENPPSGTEDQADGSSPHEAFVVIL